MAINKGSSSIKSLFVGSKQVKQVFKGSSLVWEISGISVSQSTGTSASPLVVKGASSTLTITGVGAWTASSNASWLTLSSTSGNGNSTITATAASNVHTTSSRSAVVTIKQTSSGKTATVTIYQGADSYSTSYSKPTLSISYATFAASKTTLTPTVNYSQIKTETWKSDNAQKSKTTISTGGSLSFTMTAATGFTLNNASTGSITADSRGVEYSESARTTTVKATVTLNSKTSDQVSCTISQEPNLRSVDSYSAITVKFAYDEKTPAAGTISPAGNWSQGTVYKYTSGEKYTEINLSGSIDDDYTTYSGSGTGATINATTGVVTWTANTGAKRSFTVTATVSRNGVTGSATATCSQEADYITKTTYANPVVTFNDYGSKNAAAGNIAISATPTYSQTITYEWASKKANTTSTQKTNGTITYSGSATGATVNASNGTVTWTANTSESSTRSVTVTATVSMNGKSGSDTATSTQAKDGISSYAYANPTVSLSYGTNAEPNANATQSPSISYNQVRTNNYISGKSSTTTNLTSGGTVSYTESTDHSAATVKSSTGVVTWGQNTGSARSCGVTATVTLNGKSGSKAATATQKADYIKSTSYGNVTAGAITNTTIPASGTTTNYTATAGNGSQVITYTWASGKANTSETKTISPSVASISATANSKGTTVSNTTTVKSQAVTWTGSGNKSASGTMYIYQAANAANASYDSPVITKYTYGTFAATGSTLTPSVTYYQTPRYTSGSPGANITSGGTLGYQMGSYTGFTLNSSSTGSITAARNPNTSTRSATPQVRVTLNGKTSSWFNCQSCTQAANGSVAFTLESGNSNTPLGAFADSSTMYITAVGGWTITCPSWITFSTKSGSGNAQPTFSCTANAKNTSQRTGTITLTSTIDSSVVASRTVYQSADSYTDKYTSVSNCAIGEPNFEGNFTASGGSAMMDAPATWNAVGTRTWASGATDALSGARSGEAILSFNTNSPSGAFSISGQTVTHRNMTNNATTDKVQIKYTHPQNSGVTKLGGTYSVTNSLTSTTRTMSANTTSVAATGGTITLTCNSTNTYTAGTYNASTALTATAGTLSKTSISGTGQTVTLTVPANTGAARSIYVKMDGTTKVTITQAAGAAPTVYCSFVDDGLDSNIDVTVNGVNMNSGGESKVTSAGFEIAFYNNSSYEYIDCYITDSDGNDFDYVTVEPGNEGIIYVSESDYNDWFASDNAIYWHS